jgi:hypothetical protein
MLVASLIFFDMTILLVAVSVAVAAPQTKPRMA